MMGQLDLGGHWNTAAVGGLDLDDALGASATHQGAVWVLTEPNEFLFFRCICVGLVEHAHTHI